MPEGGELTLAGKRENDDIVVTISDTGFGMDEDTVKKIFDPFYTTKPSKIHSGLGLAVVDGLLQTTGGRIRVDSKPGQGTTFTLDLPAAENTGLPAGEDSSELIPTFSTADLL